MQVLASLPVSSKRICTDELLDNLKFFSETRLQQDQAGHQLSEASFVWSSRVASAFEFSVGTCHFRSNLKNNLQPPVHLFGAN